MIATSLSVPRNIIALSYTNYSRYLRVCFVAERDKVVCAYFGGESAWVSGAEH